MEVESGKDAAPNYTRPIVNTDIISLVVPGRNCASTIRQCMAAVVPLLDRGRLEEIVFVDDGSTDGTAEIVAGLPVQYIAGSGRGPGAARNIGWKAAHHPLVWFVDADCVAEHDALERLLPHLDDPKVGGVAGSYGILNPESLLACLTHEEIRERHLTMPARVNFLAAANVLYRRAILEQVDGFDERYLKAQDAELSFRVMAAGHELAFEKRALVKHCYHTSWRRYLQTQRQQGYWRVWLHLSHRGHAAGDSYSSFVDHVQPPLAMLLLASLVLLLFPYLRWVPPALFLLLTVAQVPMTYRLVRRLRRGRYAVFMFMGFVRSFYRGVGMIHGMVGYLRSRLRRTR